MLGRTALVWSSELPQVFSEKHFVRFSWGRSREADFSDSSLFLGHCEEAITPGEGV